MKVFHYELRVENGPTFYAKQEVWNPMLDRLSIGARRKCMVLTIYKDTPDEYPHLDGYTHHDECNYEGKMQRGTVTLLRAGIALMHVLYPFTRGMPIELKDESFIVCRQGYKLPLHSYYVAYHGGSWYQQKMGAIPHPTEDAKGYQEGVERVQQIMTSHLPPWKTFVQQYPLSPDTMQLLKARWSSRITWLDLLHDVKKQDCIVFRGWLDTWVRHHMRVGLIHRWRIPSSVVGDIIVHVRSIDKAPKGMFPIQRGGALPEMRISLP